MDDYRLVFIVSILLLRKNLNESQKYLHGIVAYTFLDRPKDEKINQFLSSIKKDAHKRKLVSFFCLTV